MVEIVVDTGKNGDLLFHPAGERVRGAFQPVNVAAEDIGPLCRDFPQGIPGAVIGFDPATGCGYIRDPLATAEHAGTRAKIEQRGASLSGQPVRYEYPAAAKEFPNAHGPTWLGHMARAVKAGLAKVVKGKVPDNDPPDMRKGFYFQERTDPKDATINQLIGLLAAQLPEAKKKELAALFAPAK